MFSVFPTTPPWETLSLNLPPHSFRNPRTLPQNPRGKFARVVDDKNPETRLKFNVGGITARWGNVMPRVQSFIAVDGFKNDQKHRRIRTWSPPPPRSDEVLFFLFAPAAETGTAAARGWNLVTVLF